MYIRRPLFTNDDIVSMMINKMEFNRHTFLDLMKIYNISEKYAKLFVDYESRYNFDMLKIASNYLNVELIELLAILEYEEKVDIDKKTEYELNYALNYIFDTMIKQSVLSKNKTFHT
ncbi:hypothetical protein BFS06_11790 [Clostridium perfringens]|uniref:HTH cro/C1-type domain-containing protein n=1 Tax=Clostridium perfringens TaxID=1502 RepID=A0A140GS69_CLOPF|nr:hypothetical protein [Clostridium perfringens]AMN31378.1 hypothetical protein JFP838_pA0462 [Clostridium perfringens]TBX14894.1 hypothetical protein BFS06_11790 [Clostridium perfringens]